MKNRDDKRKDLEDLKKKIGENPNIFVTGFEKIDRVAGFRAAKD